MQPIYLVILEQLVSKVHLSTYCSVGPYFKYRKFGRGVIWTNRNFINIIIQLNEEIYKSFKSVCILL